MTKTLSVLTGLMSVVALVVALAAFDSKGSASTEPVETKTFKGALFEGLPKWFGKGLSAGSSEQFSIDESGNVITSGTLTTTGTMALASTTVNGLLTNSPAVAATTTTGGNAATLSQANLLGSQYWTVNVNQAADFTYTLPASTTLSTLVANTGESATFTFHNATTAAGIDVVFAAGTGIDLEGSTTSLKLLPNTTGSITLTRKANTDVTATFRPNADLD